MRYVGIGCVASGPVAVEPDASLPAVFDRLVAYWRDRLAVVLPDEPDLIVLPEMCDLPAGLDVGRQLEFIAHRKDSIADAFAEIAVAHHCYIAYSAFRTAADGGLYNSIQVLGRDGSLVGVYDKNYPTASEHNLWAIRWGAGPAAFELDFGRVVGVICFDLNFTELLAANAALDPDLIVFSSAYHGALMQRYWAYQCRAYLAACVHPPAPSEITSPVGEVLHSSTNYRDDVTGRVNLDVALVHLDGNRPKLADAKRRYGRKIGIHDPGRLGSVLLSSETDEFTVDHVIAEHGIVTLDDFFARSREQRMTMTATAAVTGAAT